MEGREWGGKRREGDRKGEGEGESNKNPPSDRSGYGPVHIRHNNVWLHWRKVWPGTTSKILQKFPLDNCDDQVERGDLLPYQPNYHLSQSVHRYFLEVCSHVWPRPMTTLKIPCFYSAAFKAQQNALGFSHAPARGHQA